MVSMKETAALVFTAGVLAAGVHGYVQHRSAVTDPVQAPAAAPRTPGAVTSPEPNMAQARDRLRDALSASRDASPAVTAMRTGVPVAAPPAPRAEDPLAEAAANAVRQAAVEVPPRVGEPAAPIQVSPAAPPPDPRWTSTPHPELIAKADAAFDNGDVSGARLWLEEALGQGDADAAYRLAETYDPNVLAKWKVIGMASDVPRARALYERAMNGGVEAARQRLAGNAP